MDSIPHSNTAMASLSQLITKPPCPAKRTSPVSPSFPFLPAQARAPLSTHTHKHNPAILFSAKNPNNQNDSDEALNRRDVLTSLGGIYGAAAAVNTKNVAKAEPVATPPIDKCGPFDLPKGAVPTSSCPPESAKAPKKFTPPGLDTPLRVLQAAHMVDEAYIDKFIDVLIGLIGIYGAAAAVYKKIFPKKELEDIQPIKNCGPVDLPKGAVPMSCCPPRSAKDPKIFTPLGLDTPLRVRPAAHMVDKAYIDKFSEALRRMKALPADDPRSFKQQAMIHCAYCDGAYDQAGFPNIELQVHGNWLFFPFHRCYLYYFERILGSLINDPTFAMPYWNWDSAAGMKMPTMYTNERLPMFNVFRNPDHMPHKTVDLDFGDDMLHNGSHDNLSGSQMVMQNLAIMYRQMKRNSSTPELFFGKAYRAGDKKPSPGAGSIEHVPHNTILDWVGDPLQPNHEDMGSLYSAGRDPIFYAHHSNVDRMWNIWKSTLGRRNIDIRDPDWLNASFHFYDENAELVQITVADCLDSERQMRYKYEDMPIEWLEPQVTVMPKTRSLESRPILKEAQFPLVLDTPIRATMRRPKTNRTDAEKKLTEEVLKIIGIKYDRDIRAKFDVFVNANNHETVKPAGREFIGSFTHVPHMHKHDKMGMGIETTIQFGLTEVIDDLGINGNETIEVTLVPRQGQGKVTVSGVEVEFMLST